MSNLPSKFSFVDVETTGTSALADRIIEIAIIRVEDNKVCQQFETLVNPQTYISPYIEAITGITQRQVEDAPSFDSVAPQILDLLNEAIFVAHNVRFDYSFVRLELARAGVNFSAPKFCTVKLSRTLFPNLHHHDLDSVISRHNIKIEKRHRAMDDTKAIWEFFNLMKETLPPQTFDEAIKACLKRPAFPVQLPQPRLENIPEGPGVYIFYGKNSIPLYVGKSIHLKERILSHFTQNDLGVDQKICQETVDFEVILTGGELGALIKEAQLVKSLQPIYNRKLRRTQEMTALVGMQNDLGYETAQTVVIKTLEPQDIGNILGVFRSRKQALTHLRKLIKEYHLCPKLLHLDNTRGACIHKQFGWCKGACVNQEDKATYNERFQKAFEQTRISNWPFRGPVTVVEKDPISDKEEVFVINNWCLVEINSDEQEQNSHRFDLDTYKILKRYLHTHRRRRNIHSLPSAETPAIA